MNRYKSNLKSNIEGYLLLNLIENGIRELIIETLTRYEGDLWYKNRLPSDIYEKYKSGFKNEKSTKWIDQILHHPLYYIDFPDLRKIICQRNNWENIFAKYFNNKEVFMSELFSIENIRNKVAHNRRISNNDIIILNCVYVMLSNAIGEEKLTSLASNITSCTNMKFEIEKLNQNIITLYEQMISYKNDLKIITLESFRNKWWFDSDYLGVDVTPIFEFIDMIKNYLQIPRGMGLGYLKEKFIKEISAKDNLEKCLIAIKEILN